MDKQNPLVEISVDCVPLFSYSLANVMRTPLRGISIKNNMPDDISDVMIAIDSSTDLLSDKEIPIPVIPAGQTVEVDCSSITIDTNRMLQLTEGMTDELKVQFFQGGKLLAEDVSSVRFFAFDEWLGPSMADTLASFVTPNHPALAPIIVAASRYLEDWTGSSAFDGYQTEDPERVRMQAAALFRALQDTNIVYVGAPASFGPGQRIRMPNAVIEQHMATCLDFSVLYAACIEAVDLRPLLFLMDGHAFAGVWLEETSFQESIEGDSAKISKLCSKGVKKMIAVQCTDMAQGSSQQFEDAERTGRNLISPESFHCAIDINRARIDGVLPLPIRVQGEEGWTVEVASKEHEKIAAPEKCAVSTAFLDVAAEKKTKKQVWERSLLDLSMHNPLLNMRFGKRAMPILVSSIDELEDTMARDNDLIIAPKPSAFPPVENAFEILGINDEVGDLLKSEFKEGRLRTLFTEGELKKNLDTLFRSAKSSLEETGANTLFLTLGCLRWIDRKRGNQARYAPIMLFPIEIIKKSAKSGYIMRLRDEEPQVNISLIEMLRLDYDIHVNGLDPLPQDEAGVDTRLVLNTFTNKIMDQENWEVLETAAVGLFSFSQFVMWNDIHSHEEELRNSKIVDSLMEGHLTWDAKPLDPNEIVDPSSLVLPIEADSSQLFAIKSAVEGESFVLHGPPGTGKSQTITAIIANALVRGQKALFVAEKMAALEVVEKRLANLGIGQFCLEIHSTKATKNHVFEQIQTASELGESADASGYAAKAEEVRALRGKLDAYAKGLTAKNAAGLTLREQICRYEHLRKIADPLEVDRTFIRSLSSPRDFAAAMNAAERLVAMASDEASANDHPLHFVTGFEYSRALEDEVSSVLDDYRDALERLEGLAAKAAALFDEKTPTAFADLRALDEACSWLVASSGLPFEWFAAGDMAQAISAIEVACAAEASLRELREGMSKHWCDSFFDLDSSEVKNEWIEAHSKGLFGRGKAISRFVAKLSLCSIGSMGTDDVEPAIREREAYERAKANRDACVEAAAQYLSCFAKGPSYDWEAVGASLEEAKRLASRPAAAVRGALPAQALGDGAVEVAKRFGESFDRARKVSDRLNELVGAFSADGSADSGVDWISANRENCGALRESMGLLRERMAWNAAARTVRSLGLGPLVSRLEEGPRSEGIMDSLRCGVYRAMCFESLDSTEGMNNFSGSRFDEMVKQYARADEQLRELAKREVYLKTASYVPNLTIASVTNPRAASLQKALRSRGRNITIRSILSDTGDVVRDLCPCFLMSPISVAQYLEPGKQQFDLLIFDEASQLQTCKAIGALSRAKAAVIVGDPRQMPPTSFFQAKSDGADYEEVNDLESILEDCLALNMPQAYLRWHYRSQHESLIAFSNQRFYENKMMTFPSADDRTSRVEFHKVDGYFDRGGSRVNAAEARAVVDEVVRRSKDSALRDQSLGVVTFNIPQQMLIEDLLQEACAADPALDEWVNKSSELVFVKNLENVQGDERDVIFFSITYAPDKQGKMSMNFGPINREGGWRRLNVAVTRARVSMAVFTSMEPTDIDLNRASSMGPASLRAFISYAKRGAYESTISADSACVANDEIANDLCEAIGGAGFKVRRNVGRSLFKVDIGVVDPWDDGRYLAGILLDGDTYEKTKAVRDREVSQPSLLRRLGWNEIRVWAIDWFDNRETTVAGVLRFLDDLKAEREAEEGALPERSQAQAAQVEEAPKGTTGLGVELEAEPAPTPEPAPEVEPEVEPEPAPVAEPALESARQHDPEPDLDPELAPAPQPDHDSELSPESAAEPTSAPEPSPKVDLAPSPDLFAGEAYMVSPVSAPMPESGDLGSVDDRELGDVIASILADEAPIELNLLVKRISQAYGFARVGSKIQKKCEGALKYASCTKVSQAKRTIVWRKDQDPKTFFTYRVSADDSERRAANELPLEEIAAAACASLQHDGPLQQGDLVRATSSLLGYKRLTASVEDFVKKGITLAVRRGAISREGDLCVLPSEANA